MKKLCFVIGLVSFTFSLLFGADNPNPKGSQTVNGKVVGIDDPQNPHESEGWGNFFKLYRSDKYDEFLKLFDELAGNPYFDEDYHFGKKLDVEIYKNIDSENLREIVNKHVDHRMIFSAKYKLSEPKPGPIEIRSPNLIFIKGDVGVAKSAKTGKEIIIHTKVNLIYPVNDLAEWFFYYFCGRFAGIDEVVETADSYIVTVNVDKCRIYIDPGI